MVFGVWMYHRATGFAPLDFLKTLKQLIGWLTSLSIANFDPNYLKVMLNNAAKSMVKVATDLKVSYLQLHNAICLCQGLCCLQGYPRESFRDQQTNFRGEESFPQGHQHTSFGALKLPTPQLSPTPVISR